jgi:hypothetical protein
MAKSKAEYCLDKFKKLKSYRGNREAQWAEIAKYVHQNKRAFGHDPLPEGSDLVSDIYDDTAAQANNTMASALLGAMWPNGAKSFVIEPHEFLEGSKLLDQTKVREFFVFQTRRLTQLMDNPRAGIITTLAEYMLDQGSFGTSGVGIFERDDMYQPFIAKAYDCVSTVIDETFDGFVDTIYTEHIMTIRQAVIEYGIENLHSKTREAFLKGKSEEYIHILHAVEPRMEGNPTNIGAENMPIASMHIEMNTKHMIKDSGFLETPISIGRFWKAIGERYGRSPASVAMPSIQELDGLREATIFATEQSLQPPLAVFDDGSLGGGTIDLSPHAVNVFSVSGRAGAISPKDAIQQLIEIGDMRPAAARIAELTEQIANHFFIDRLLDFNNETRMTLGEANMRNKLRSESLVTTYARQIAEVFIPMITRCYNIAFRKGLLGVLKGSEEEKALIAAGITPYYIPEELLDLINQGSEIYRIRFISPASRMMRMDELEGINSTLQTATALVGLQPEALDQLDGDDILKTVAALTGAPMTSLRDASTVERVRKQRAAANQAAMEAESARTMSETARNAAQANQMADTFR